MTDSTLRPVSALMHHLGWHRHFATQITPKEAKTLCIARVTQMHRNALHVMGDDIDTSVVFPDQEVTVGDWVLVDRAATKPQRVLARKSLLKRRAAGHDRQKQLIAANLDVAFVVSSCNRDFNIARLERYIALAFEGGIAPVIVLSKADLCADTSPFEQAARALSEQVPVVCVNATTDAAKTALAPWCVAGQTVGFLGSSGVGKSTLVNALTGANSQTQEVRAADSRGRHTTTYRHLHITPQGCAVLDTPGMRELQLMEAAAGINALFPDLHALTLRCKFNDCSHTVEPDCAIQSALQAGTIESDRVIRWRKLCEEEQQNTQDMAQRGKNRTGKRTKKAARNRF